MDSELTDYYYQLEQENEKLKQKVSKLEKNGLRMVDARLETLEEEMKELEREIEDEKKLEKLSDIKKDTFLGYTLWRSTKE